MPNSRKPLHNLAIRTMLAGGLALAVLFSSLFMYRNLQWQLDVQNQRALVKLDYISALVQPQITDFNTTKLQRMINELEAHDPALHAVVIKTKSGEIFGDFSTDLERTIDAEKHVFRLSKKLYEGNQQAAQNFIGEVFVSHLNQVQGWPWDKFRLAMMTMMTSSILIVSLLGYVIRISISKPLRGLVQTANAISAQGHFSQRVTINSYGEVQALAEAMNNMLTAIEERDNKLQIQADELYQQANFDALTGLPNRYFLYNQLNKLLHDATINNQKLGVLLIDLDRFKIVNDSLGHIAGDKLLQTVVERIRPTLADNYIFSRWGGDEFVVVIPNLDSADTAAKVAKAILDSLAKNTTISNQIIYIGASIGISIFPDHATSRDELISCADIGMYTSKTSQSNTYNVYSRNKLVSEQLRIETRLRQAICSNAFSVVYQAKYHAQHGTLVGLEALARWHDEELGDVPPATFIPLAEELDIINDIAHMVFNTVDRDFARWQQQGLAPVPIAVNLSPSTLLHPNFIKSIGKRLDDAAIPASMLEIEITEEVFLLDNDDVVAAMQKMRSLGIKLALDDFGSRYSTLKNLASLPLNTLKIDAVFIDNIGRSDKFENIIRAIIELAHALSLTVVAEGVETAAQQQFLRACGCDELQGFYLTPPQTAAACAALLSR